MSDKIVWKCIPGFEGLYMASRCGKIKSLHRSGRILKQGYHTKGYKLVDLSKSGARSTYGVHRLILTTFKGIDKTRLHVNHINGIKGDNRLRNLEWCTPQENTLHAQAMGLKKPTRMKKVGQYRVSGEVIKVFESGFDAMRRTGVNNRDISSCCLGKRKTAGGFIWKYI